MESRDDALLSARLAALPLESPPADAWPQLARRLQAPPRRTPRSAWWALAASLGLLTLLPWLRPGGEPATQTVPELHALMQRSQALEAEIRGLRAQNPDIDSVKYAWENAIQSDLALVDVGLADHGRRSPELWRERVRLLEELKTTTRADTGTLLLKTRLD
ncbi:MAG: hypothetical protein U1F26_02400 [Lysobacterales bacterium]